MRLRIFLWLFLGIAGCALLQFVPAVRPESKQRRWVAQPQPIIFVVIGGDRLHYINHSIHSLSTFHEKIELVFSQSIHPNTPAHLTEQTQALLDRYRSSFNSITYLQFEFPRAGLMAATRNHYKALTRTFELFPSAPDVVCLEDDIIVTPDALELVKRFRFEAAKDPSLSVGFGQAWENKHRWTRHFWRNFWSFLYSLADMQNRLLNSLTVDDDMMMHSFMWQVTRGYWFSTLGPAFELSLHGENGPPYPEPWAKCQCWNYDRMMEYLLYGTRILFPESARAYHIGTGHGMSFQNGNETDTERLAQRTVFRKFVPESEFSMSY